MKRALALGCLVLGASGVLLAQAAKPIKIAVIEIQTALISTKEGQQARLELENRLGPKQKVLEDKRAEVVALQDKLAKTQSVISQTAKDELERTIQLRTTRFQRDAEDLQAEVETEQRKVVDALGQKMSQVIDKFAQANGYAVVMDVSNPQTPVLFAINDVNITKQVVELYDKMAPGLNAAPAGQTPATPAVTKPAPPAKPKQ